MINRTHFILHDCNSSWQLLKCKPRIRVKIKFFFKAFWRITRHFPNRMNSKRREYNKKKFEWWKRETSVSTWLSDMCNFWSSFNRFKLPWHSMLFFNIDIEHRIYFVPRCPGDNYCKYWNLFEDTAMPSSWTFHQTVGFWNKKRVFPASRMTLQYSIHRSLLKSHIRRTYIYIRYERMTAAEKVHRMASWHDTYRYGILFIIRAFAQFP